MDWVEGETLFQWVKNRCRQADREALLGDAARQWPAVAAELSREQIAHGDLQHANVMVTPRGKLKLVDYDGMCVPSLAGARLPGVWELRHISIRSSNGAGRLSLRLDDFSVLLIYVALHALAVDPGLWANTSSNRITISYCFAKTIFVFAKIHSASRSVALRQVVCPPDDGKSLCGCCR